MSSPARRHFVHHTAAAAAAAAAPDAVHPDASVYEQHLAQLAEHKRRLKALQSVQRKIDVKREILPEYADYVAGVLSAGNGVQDDVLMTVMVWRIDVGDIDGALAIARYALAHKLTLPDQYKRDTATLIAEEIADGFLAGAEAVAGAAVSESTIAVLTSSLELTTDDDMPDEVRAKMHKALGYALRGTDDAAALQHLRTALALNQRIGVKKDIERLERAIKHNPPESEEGAAPTADEEDSGSGSGGGRNAAPAGTAPTV